ncbi:hypothetical protein C2G38_2209309 [Gigaspora rosea]|uniref:Uncharacterized protein n=1 Tax=Gigaspora rosea TaxID=44941 RepID=A0A397UPH2_9GLOM|nr:hypothetical protein C2G38_2209309 [Gigaspora rosea]
MLAADPRLRINLNPNVINIAAIDNIDLKDATFQYGDIFDVVRNTAHATAQMVFQYQYLELVNLNDDIRNYSPFGISSIMEQCQTTIDWIFNQLINTGQTFNIEHINEAIKTNIDSTLKSSKKNEHVHKAIDMFLEDFGYTEDELELLWTAIGVAIHQYIKPENISINNIPKTNNNILKICLMAFAPLFYITRKYSSRNIWNKISKKINMTGCATNLENLELNIKVAQTENDQLNLLISEFTNDYNSNAYEGKNKKHVRAKTNQTATEETNQIVTEKFQALELNNDIEVEKTNQNLQLESSSGLSHQKRQHSTHIPTDIQEKIFIELEKYEDSSVLLPEIVEDLVEKLAVHTDYWTSN